MESSARRSIEESNDSASLFISAFNPNRFTTTLASRPVHPEGTNNYERFPRNLQELTRPGYRVPTTVGDFIVMLGALNVPGPLMIVDPLDSRHYLGDGAQFIVYENLLLDSSSNNAIKTTLKPVAVKKCKFTLRENEQVDLSVDVSRAQIHDMQMEIAALQDLRLREHPNIVDLLGWGVEDSWHESPLLVLELAIGDLEHFLIRSDNRTTWGTRQQLLLDISAGLDAIHECRITHGDLKSKNVLVFERFTKEVPFKAKLADFGIAIDETGANENDLVRISGHSPGWSAPEVELSFSRNIMISTSQLLKADNYSFGLLILSCICFRGAVPTLHSIPLATQILSHTSDIPVLLQSTLTNALTLLLKKEHSERPFLVGTLLRDISKASQDWITEFQDYQEYWKSTYGNGYHAHDWTLPSLAPFLFQGLEKSYQRHHTALSGQELFAMFLLRSVHDIPEDDKNLQISMLIESAEKGYIPARAIARRVVSSYGQQLSDCKNPSLIDEWLFEGASTGSLQAAAELSVANPALLEKAMGKFRRDAGFNQFYSPITNAHPSRISGDLKNEITDEEDSDGNGALHYCAALGDLHELKVLLIDRSTNINVKNYRGETALYKACLTGCWRSVLELCRHGADASIPVSSKLVTCLHWLFNFPASHSREVAKALFECHADPKAMLKMPGPAPTVINYHFPFTWPPGSPLHWATAASSLSAVTALLELGSDPCQRNGYDPYVTDENVRQLHCHGTIEEGDFSEPSQYCLGLNAVDLAASRHDWKVLECIYANCKHDQILSPDEEGYTPFHRLSSLRIGRTSQGLRFFNLAFLGDSSERLSNIAKTIQVLQSMGGDINQLTANPREPGLMGVDGLNPLMLAVTKSDAETVASLLMCGADPNAINRTGRSALTLLPEATAGKTQPGSLCAIIQCLLEHGADINHQSLDEMTPLLSAVNSHSLEAVMLLLKSGADTATFFQGLNVMAVMLLRYAHRYNVRFKRPKRPIKALERETDIATMFKRWICPQPAILNLIVDRDHGTWLHYAARAGLEECVSVLLENGSDVNALRKVDVFMPKHAIYNSDARLMTTGTPLDVVQREIYRFTQHRSDNLRQIDVDFVMGKLHAVRSLIQNYGGKSMVEIEGNLF